MRGVKSPGGSGGQAGLMRLEDALEQMLARVQPIARAERIQTLEADGRVLAQDVVSALNVPAFDNSQMDGYALRVGDVQAQGPHPAAAVLPVSQRIAAGQWPRPLEALSVARIFTGAPIPPGADAVVMQEECTVVNECEGGVRIPMTPSIGQWIRRAGEDVKEGSTVLGQGLRLSPAALGLAASIGCATLPVVARPRVALLCTGDELLMPGEVDPREMRPGAIYNSNRFFLRALLNRLGCEVSDLGNVADNFQATCRALDEAAADHDVILTSGGVSVGQEDHIRPAVEQLGELHLWQIAMKPGKPFSFGKLTRAGARPYFLGLPGNPVSSFVTFVLLVRPMLLRLQGVQDVSVPISQMQADFEITQADRRREFLRVRRSACGRLQLFANQGSGVLTSAMWADGFVDKAAGATIACGDTVSFIAMSDLLGGV